VKPRHGGLCQPRSGLGIIALFAALWAICCQVRGADPKAPLVVQDVLCRGNVTISCNFIRGHLFLRAGQALDEDEIGNGQLRLAGLPNFTSVAIHLEKGSEKGRVLVVIQVLEAAPIVTAVSAGLSYRSPGLSAMLSGRIGDHNLFGAGKSLDLIAVGEIPSSGSSSREFLARLEYVDPQLFGSNRFFFYGGAYHLDSAYRYGNGDSYVNEVSGVDASLGVRFGRFSYITVGYQILRHSSFDSISRTLVGGFNIRHDSPKGARLLGYGFNSQDDPYFPTRGSLLNLYTAVGASLGDPYFTGSEFRHTWHSEGEAFVTLQLRVASVREDRASFDGDPLLSVSYAHTLPPSDLFGGIRRARWYVDPGVTPATYSPDGHRTWEVGLKVGIRLETRTFGLVNLYVIGSGLAETGSSR
jgi:outer membrane protein assembly factor BamA